MGERSGRTTRRFESADLIERTKKPIVAPEDRLATQDDDPLGDWDELTPPVVATGSQPQALPTTARTATVHDPMTTAMLAEVARRTSTMEIDPSTMADAARSTVEFDPETLEEVRRSSQRTPVPEVHANTKRRTK